MQALFRYPDLGLVLLVTLELWLTDIDTSFLVFEIKVAMPVLTSTFFNSRHQENSIVLLDKFLTIFVHGVAEPVEDKSIFMVRDTLEIVETTDFVCCELTFLTDLETVLLIKLAKLFWEFCKFFVDVVPVVFLIASKVLEN